MNIYPACKLFFILKSRSLIFFSLLALGQDSQGLFLSWVLGDNSHISKAPNMWHDLVPAYDSFLSESTPAPTPLEKKFWWTEMAGSSRPLQELKGVFRCPTLFEGLKLVRKIPFFRQDERNFLEGWGKGMQNVSWIFS